MVLVTVDFRLKQVLLILSFYALWVTEGQCIQICPELNSNEV